MDRGHRVRNGKNLCSSEMGPVAGSCEYISNPSRFIKSGDFLTSWATYLSSQKHVPSRHHKPRRHMVGEYFNAVNSPTLRAGGMWQRE
jgi:hypothetical protein